MNHGIRLRIWGPTASFTRPETKVEQVSYDIITPSAARGILEAVYWKPEIRWIVTALHVFAPIRFMSIRRNGVASKASDKIAGAAMRAGVGSVALYADEDRQQMAAQVLRDVHYVVEARFDIRSGQDNAGKHLGMFERRAREGQCFHRPYLGCREHACHFAWLDKSQPLPRPNQPLPADWRTGIETIDRADRQSLLGRRDLGMMLHDIDHDRGHIAHFFRATMIDGSVTGIDSRRTFA
jgi:CRISPR-associated protein Cas5d